MKILDLRRRQEELDRLEAAKKERMEMIRRRDEERLERTQRYGGSSSQLPFSAFGSSGGLFSGPPPSVSVSFSFYEHSLESSNKLLTEFFYS